MFAAGIGLRVLTVVAYRPAIMYVDSVRIYLNHLPGSTLPFATTPSADPLGYNLFLLRPVLAVGNLLTVAVVQHLLGLAMAVATYAVLRPPGRLAVAGRARRRAGAAGRIPAADRTHDHVGHPVRGAARRPRSPRSLWNRRPGPVAIGIAGVGLGAAPHGARGRRAARSWCSWCTS